MQWLKTLRETLKHESVGHIIRRFFINTAGLNVIIITMLTTSLALGISTGVSVYEAESLEQELKIADLEKALFTDLKDTSIHKTAKYTIIIASLINFATPLFSCAVTITPFILVAMGILPLNIAGWISVLLALSTLFGAGIYMGRIGKTNPYKKGLRMVAFGVLAFAIGFLLNLLI